MGSFFMGEEAATEAPVRNGSIGLLKVYFPWLRLDL